MEGNVVHHSQAFHGRDVHRLTMDSLCYGLANLHLTSGQAYESSTVDWIQFSKERSKERMDEIKGDVDNDSLHAFILLSNPSSLFLLMCGLGKRMLCRGHVCNSWTKKENQEIETEMHEWIHEDVQELLTARSLCHHWSTSQENWMKGLKMWMMTDSCSLPSDIRVSGRLEVLLSGWLYRITSWFIRLRPARENLLTHGKILYLGTPALTQRKREWKPR